MIISFIGHSLVLSKDSVKQQIKEQMRNNILGEKSVTCYLGGYGDFDKLCAISCKELKQEFACIETVYVSPYLNIGEQKKIKELLSLGLYDGSVYPPIESVPLRFAISKRNEWMIEKSDIIIAFVNHRYGGAYKSFQMAKRKKKKIINLCDLTE